MTPEEEYNSTKASTDRILDIFRKIMEIKKGGTWSYKPLPQHSCIDYAMYKNDNLQFFVEVKIRRCKFKDFQMTKIPASKPGFAMLLAKEFKKKSYIIIKWEDEIGMIDLLKYSGIESMVARHDRGESKDIYAMYDTNKMTLFKALLPD